MQPIALRSGTAITQGLLPQSFCGRPASSRGRLHQNRTPTRARQEHRPTAVELRTKQKAPVWRFGLIQPQEGDALVGRCPRLLWFNPAVKYVGTANAVPYLLGGRWRSIVNNFPLAFCRSDVMDVGGEATARVQVPAMRLRAGASGHRPSRTHSARSRSLVSASIPPGGSACLLCALLRCFLFGACSSSCHGYVVILTLQGQDAYSRNHESIPSSGLARDFHVVVRRW
jgi:hypothetical protein